MGMDEYVIDLETKTIYDTAGGRSLYWLLPFLKGHKICINHDNNGGMDIYVYRAKKLNFKLIDACNIKECKKVPKYVKDNNSILNTESCTLRTLAADIGNELDTAIECASSNKDNEFKAELDKHKLSLAYGYDKKLGIPWYKIDSLSTLCKYKFLLRELTPVSLKVLEEAERHKYKFK